MAGSKQVLAECPADLRAWEWRYLKQSSRRVPLAFVGHTGEVWDAAISPDGRQLASASFDQHDQALGRRPRPGSSGRSRGTRPGPIAWRSTRKGARLVSASADKTAIIWDVASGKAVQVLRGHDDNVRCAAFSFDGSTVVTGSWDGQLRAWDAATGESLRACSTQRRLDHAGGVQPRLALGRRWRLVGPGRNLGHLSKRRPEFGSKLRPVWASHSAARERHTEVRRQTGAGPERRVQP